MIKKIQKKYIIVGLLILLIMLIFALLFSLHKDRENDFFDYPDDSTKIIENCRSKDNCDTKNIDSYYKLVLKKSYDGLNEKVDKINADTDKYYKMVKESNTDSPNCSNVKDIYNHSKRVISNYTNYENKKYLSISVGRIIYDLCDNEEEVVQEDAYIYDKRAKRVLSQDEFRKKENITDEEIHDAIKREVKVIEMDFDKKIELKNKDNDIVFLYNVDGSICISFYVEEVDAYYIAMVRESADSK